MKLVEQKCIPCEGGVAPLSPEEISQHLQDLLDWKLVDNKIKKEFVFKDFVEAMEFVNQVAQVAEAEGHHPDIHIFYNQVNFELWTHAIEGLHLNDFILAAKIDEIYDANKKIIIFTDGGSRGNPGPAGVGVVVTGPDGQIIKKANKFLGVATNNEAEYQAVILGLETLKKLVAKNERDNLTVEVRLDSQLVANQLSGTFQIKEERLFPLVIKIWNLRVADFPHLSFCYIPRELNQQADSLANQAMDAA